MENQKNAERKGDFNDKQLNKNIKTNANRLNSKLLLFNNAKRKNNDIYLKITKEANFSKLAPKKNFPNFNGINNASYKNRRCFSSNLSQKKSKMFVKNNYSEEVSKSIAFNEKTGDNSINNVFIKSKDEGKIFPSTTFNQAPKKIYFTLKLNNQKSQFRQNLRYDNHHFQESKKENNLLSSMSQIKSTRNNSLNLEIPLFHSFNNKNQNHYKRNNIFRNLPVSKSFNNNFQNNKDSNNLINYKNVIYSSIPKSNNKIFQKLKKYNAEIRLRNNNINSKDNIKNERRYSFYHYEDYMNKIEKEEINMYKKYQQNKNKINIKKIFEDKHTNKIKKISSITSPRDKSKTKSELSQEILFNQSNKSLALSNILKNSGNNSNNNSVYVRIPLKKSEKDVNKSKTKEKEKEKNNDNDINNKNNESSSELTIIINNYEVKKTGIRKLRKTNTMNNIRCNFLEEFKEEKIFIESEASNGSSPNKLRGQINKALKKNLLNLSDNLGKNKTKNDNNSIKFEKIKSIPFIKNSEKNIKENEIFENLRKNYYIRREKMLKTNRTNLLAQKLLLEKIIEIDKKKKRAQRFKKNFMPFSNLHYKYSQGQINTKKKEILDKYYKKNMSINKFSVRLKNKSSMSFFTNNSINSSQFNYNYNDLKSEYFSINDLLNNETTPRDYEISKDKFENNNIINKEQKKIKFSNNNFENLTVNDNVHENFIDLNEEKEPKLNKSIKKDEKKVKIKIDELLNNMIKEKQKKKFEKEFFQKYENLMKKREKQEKLKKKKEIITDEMIEEVNNNFFYLLDENERIITKATKKNEDAELFIDFRNKMNSLAKYAKKELNLYIYKNYDIIVNILEECKRDKQKEIRINKFFQFLCQDLDDIIFKRKEILKTLQALDYQPFSSNNSTNMQ